MSWIAWVAVLIIWPLLGLAAAYLFGRFAQRGEAYENAGERSPPVVTYLRRAKRSQVSSRAGAQAKARRSGGLRRTP